MNIPSLSSPSAEELKNAHETSWARYGYPPVKGTLTIEYETHASFGGTGKPFPYVRHSAIPDALKEAVYSLCIGSACPLIDDKRDAIYVHDVERFLRSLGYLTQLVEKP